MANTVNRLKIMDGPSHVTLHTFLQSDGYTGELKNYVLLDPAVDLQPLMPKRQDLLLKQVWYELGGFTVTFSFNATSPWPAWTLTPGASLRHDWRFFGGLKDNSSMSLLANSASPGNGGDLTQLGQSLNPPILTGGLESDGKLLISTNGFTDTKNSGAFILWLEKRDRLNPQPY